MTRRIRLLVILVVTVAATILVLALPPLPQSPDYHAFADQRAWFGIPNLLNVISNAAFLLVGVPALLFLSRHRGSCPNGAFSKRVEQWPYAVLFLGIALTGIGSAYYHLAPDNARLVWDRLPMTIAFTAILSTIISERISLKAGLLSLVLLVTVGIGSVAYWHVTELRGHGDLRPYIFVQFFPALAIPLIMLLFPSRYSRGKYIAGTLILYALAKVFEGLDRHLFAFGGVVSGHTLKHLAAAAATYVILRMLQKRELVVPESD